MVFGGRDGSFLTEILRTHVYDLVREGEWDVDDDGDRPPAEDEYPVVSFGQLRFEANFPARDLADRICVAITDILEGPETEYAPNRETARELELIVVQMASLLELPFGEPLPEPETTESTLGDRKT